MDKLEALEDMTKSPMTSTPMPPIFTSKLIIFIN